MSSGSAKITWLDCSFSEFTLEQLYAVIQLRQSVFVVEQNCPYLDADGVDPDSRHLLGYINGELVLYTRYFLHPTHPNEGVIGRVIVKDRYRQKGLGLLLMQQTESCLRESFSVDCISLGAQAHLQYFYQQIGYVVNGEQYDEDGIPHLPMIKIYSAS